MQREAALGGGERSGHHDPRLSAQRDGTKGAVAPFGAGGGKAADRCGGKLCQRRLAFVQVVRQREQLVIAFDDATDAAASCAPPARVRTSRQAAVEREVNLTST